MDPSHNVHTAYHAPEGRKALAIWIALTSVVQLRLVSYANEELGRSVIYGCASHGHCTVAMAQSSLPSALEADRTQSIGFPVGICVALNYCNWSPGAHLVIRTNSSAESSALVGAPCNVAKEVAARERGVLQVDFEFDRPQPRFNHYERMLLS